jgi:hypothetical protein
MATVPKIENLHPSRLNLFAMRCLREVCLGSVHEECADFVPEVAAQNEEAREQQNVSAFNARCRMLESKAILCPVQSLSPRPVHVRRQHSDSSNDAVRAFGFSIHSGLLLSAVKTL